MKNRQLFISALTVALALGTAWAVRGKFGHEQGAAWAGAIGALAVVLVAKRGDWYNRAFKIALAAAFGWGIGGMISYGVVVGYGRGVDFVNVYYGLAMLFVIGALYGFLGGGLFGLALADTAPNKIKWHSLIVEMTAWGLLTYAFLVNQLEWFMTPPRSEMWAGCLGAAIALAWFMIRNRQRSSLTVAVWSALGAGFGFAFGNFLQVLGSVLHIPFNFWNVMEYAIGFFGGLGMAYGTLISEWPVMAEKQTRDSNLLPILLLAVFIPFVVWDQSFVTDRLRDVVSGDATGETVLALKLIALASILLVAAIVITEYYGRVKKDDVHYSYAAIRKVFVLSLGVYTFLSFLVTGLYSHPLEQYLYLVNIGVILFVLPRLNGSVALQKDSAGRWLVATALVVLVIALLAVVAISSHGELKGSQVRFQ
jgi:hypothetical protein